MSATYAAYAAAYAAGAARYAADAADAADAARPKTFKRCADIVRTHYPTPPRLVTVRRWHDSTATEAARPQRGVRW